MKYSVIINNYNYAAFIPEAVESAFAQFHPPAEVIFVDDGSNDNSLSIARQIAGNHPNFRIISQDNGGHLAAIRTGIEAAASDWCAFLDSDDIWQPEHMALAARAIERYPDLGVHYSGHRETAGPPIFRSKWPTGILGPCTALTLDTRCRIGTITSTIVMNATLAKRLSKTLDGIETSWRARADDCLLFGASMLGAKFHHDPTQSLDYRIHGKNLTAGNMHGDNEPHKTRINQLLERLASYEGITPEALGKLLLSESRSPYNDRHPRIRRRYMRAILARDDIKVLIKTISVIRALTPRRVRAL